MFSRNTAWLSFFYPMFVKVPVGLIISVAGKCTQLSGLTNQTQVLKMEKLTLDRNVRSSIIVIVLDI